MTWNPHTGTNPNLPEGTYVEYVLAGDPKSYVDCAADVYWGPGLGDDGEGRVEKWRLAGSGGVGDVTSNERGSAARYNAGKAPLELIPAEIIATVGSDGRYAERSTRLALVRLGDFQMRRMDSVSALSGALHSLDDPNDPIFESAARVFDYGRRKYAAWNWAKGQAWSIPIGSAMRHLLAMCRGEEVDPESGLPHAGHAACNIIMLLWFAERYTEGDDRIKVAA